MSDDIESRLAAAEAERDALKDQLLAVRELHFKDGKLDSVLCGEVARTFAMSLVQFYRQQGGQNYVEMGMLDPKTLERFTVTVQRVEGKSPHELKAAAEARVEELEAALREMLTTPWKHAPDCDMRETACPVEECGCSEPPWIGIARAALGGRP